MSGIRGKNTKPEMTVRRALHAAGFRFRLHVATLPGRPDLVLPKWRSIVMVHGCFWHGHRCRLFKVPGTNTERWLAKIDGNRVRDEADVEKLLSLGWRVGIVWECALRSPALPQILADLGEWLKSGSKNELREFVAGGAV